MGHQIEVTKGALSDIAQLGAGTNRVEVALCALGEESPSAEQMKLLKAVLAKWEDGVREASSDPSTLQARKMALMEVFKIEVLGEGKVALSLQGASRIGFLHRVQSLALELYGHPAISSDYLLRWNNSPEFQERSSEGLRIAIDGNVKNSTHLSRAEQEAQGWNNVDLKDLVVAHAAYFLATGQDLFGGNNVRARKGEYYLGNRGELAFRNDGVRVESSHNAGYANVAASSALPSRG